MAQFGVYNNSSSPKMKWYADLSYTRISNSVVRVTLTVTGEIVNHMSSSWIGTGNAITAYATVNGVSKNSVIKASAASWYGNTNNPRSCSFSFDVPSSAAGTSIPVSYYVSASGYAAPAAVPTQSTSFLTPAMLYVASDLNLTSMVNGAYTDTVHATITPQHSSFRHKIVYSCNGHTVTHTDVATSDSLQIPPLWIPNNGSAKVTAVCTTYNGSTEIGSDSDYTTAIVPASVVPTISGVSAARIDGTVPAAWGVYVQGKSAVKLTVTASGAQGSTIKAYKITGGGYTGSTNPFQTGLLNTAGEITFNVAVTDSRGRSSAAYTFKVNVIAYASPKISAVLTKRCDSAGADNDEGTYALCKGTCSTSSVSGKNVITRKLYYRQYGTDAWTQAGTWTSGAASVIGAGLLSPDRTYEIKYEVADSFTAASPVSRIDLLSSAHYLFDLYEDDDGNQFFALGKAAETPNLIDLAHPVSAPSAAFSSALKLGGKDVPTIEAGIWTPVLAGSVTYASRSGRYIKVGNLVWITCDIKLSSKGSTTSALTITGLPFQPTANTALAQSFDYATKTPQVAIAESTNFIRLTHDNNGSWSTMTHASINDDFHALISGCYPCAG